MNKGNNLQEHSGAAFQGFIIFSDEQPRYSPHRRTINIEKDWRLPYHANQEITRAGCCRFAGR